MISNLENLAGALYTEAMHMGEKDLRLHAPFMI